MRRIDDYDDGGGDDDNGGGGYDDDIHIERAPYTENKRLQNSWNFPEIYDEETKEGNSLEATKEIDEDVINEKLPNDEELGYRDLESIFYCPSHYYAVNNKCLTQYQLLYMKKFYDVK
ncbi:unnamed protein product [Pieris brassicae]|uniref:Uncharacterized protein n=1 Tax=Pieris brassicae TaxID=7116 RepID=A0A9P0XGI7_PIEBR|nr:unnamed protein product [Pieris brassicae]